MIELKFYSPTNDYIASLRNDFNNCGHLNVQIKCDINGDLKSFKFSISRDVDIPFFNLMKTQIWIDGVHWYTGELDYIAGQDEKKNKHEFEGKGFYNYFDKKTINEVYQNKTLKYILDDLVGTQMSGYPIIFDTSLIVPPNLTLVKLELNDKDVLKAINDLTDYANYDMENARYRWWIDKNLKFNFALISTDIQMAFFEGFQYHEPETKIKTDKMTNKIKLYRSQEGSETSEYISTVEDTVSQGLYGIRESKISYSDYVSQDIAENIANAKLKLFKDPVQSQTLKKVSCQASPFPFGWYYLNNMRNDYTFPISDCEDTTGWITQLVHTTFTTSTAKVLTGKKSFVINVGIGATGDYIEYTLANPIKFPTWFNLYVSQYPKGNALSITFWDTRGNVIGLTTDQQLQLENGNYLTTEDGRQIKLETGNLAFSILLENDFQKQVFDVSSLEDIQKIRITFKNDDALFINEIDNNFDGFLLQEDDSYLVQEEGVANYLIYIDRLEIKTNTYKQNELLLQQIKYELDDTTFLADMDFGDKEENILKDIKELNDKSQNLINIFQKS